MREEEEAGVAKGRKGHCSEAEMGEKNTSFYRRSSSQIRRVQMRLWPVEVTECREDGCSELRAAQWQKHQRPRVVVEETWAFHSFHLE